jgi:hypothetical protein
MNLLKTKTAYWTLENGELRKNHANKFLNT